jgi:hypothetical protein
LNEPFFCNQVHTTDIKSGIREGSTNVSMSSQFGQPEISRMQSFQENEEDEKD